MLLLFGGKIPGFQEEEFDLTAGHTKVCVQLDFLARHALCRLSTDIFILRWRFLILLKVPSVWPRNNSIHVQGVTQPKIKSLCTNCLCNDVQEKFKLCKISDLFFVSLQSWAQESENVFLQELSSVLLHYCYESCFTAFFLLFLFLRMEKSLRLS